MLCVLKKLNFFCRVASAINKNKSSASHPSLVRCAEVKMIKNDEFDQIKTQPEASSEQQQITQKTQNENNET